MPTRSVRARHIQLMGSGHRSASIIRTSDLVLALAGVATLDGFCVLNAADIVGNPAGI